VTEERDAVVVGAGPAGLAAAGALAGRSLSVRLIDEQPAAGGQIWRGGGPSRALAAASAAGVDHAPGATVIDADAGDAVEVAWLGAGGVRETRARALVIATGAMERPVLFPGATLPGVMGVGAVQAALKGAGLVPGGPGVVLAGQGPLLLLALAQVLRAGGSVDAVLDLAPPGALRRAAPLLPRAAISDPVALARGAALLAGGRRVARHRGVGGLRALGEERVEAVAFEAGGVRHELPCRLLAVHDGVIPNVQLARLLGLPHGWRAGQGAFAPRLDPNGRAADAVWVAGDGGGIAGAEAAGLSGRLARLDAARALGRGAPMRGGEGGLRRRIAGGRPARRFLDGLFAPLPVLAHAGDDTLVCRCEAVTLGEIRAAMASGATGPNRVKTFTRCGMGACQGRQCSNPLTRILAAGTGADPDALGALRIRPPLVPVTIADFLGSDHPKAAAAAPRAGVAP
jgi:NADPH-dependent 2,4-dienoyl-CoA reductase/sulfur reductase-like enzyme